MVLNKELFLKLKKLNGGRDPKIIDRNAEFKWSVGWRKNGKKFLQQISGEQYAIDCPFCGDKRCRLYVSHVFGMSSPDEDAERGKITSLAFCQNEQKVKQELFGYMQDKGSIYSEYDLVRIDKPEEEESQVISMGETIPLHMVQPTHEVHKYLAGRGLDSQDLGRNYHVSLSISHPDEMVHRMVSGRMIFPFYVDHKVAAWQARLTRNLNPGEKYPPKWYFPPGLKKTFWNFDQAKNFDVAILAEGILSAINFGPAGMSVGGKTLTYRMKRLLSQRKWRGIFVALDPDAGVNRDKEVCRIDYQRRMIDEIKELDIPASGIRWEKGDMRDPGDIGPLECIRMMKRDAPEMAGLLGYADDT